MRITRFIILTAFLGVISSCGNKLPDSYHMEKKYWDVEDYDSAIRYMKYQLNKEEGYPRLSDPMTASVFNKLVDIQNVSIVLEDESLGLKHRDEVADDFWDASRDILKIYQVLDIQDKYIYPKELVRSIKFNMHTQLLYFKTGNHRMLKEAIDPNDPDIERIVQRNQQSIVSNFINYLDFLAKEDAFSPDAIEELANVFDTYFRQLLIDNPNSNYSEMKKRIRLLLERCDSESIITVLRSLLTRIEE